MHNFRRILTTSVAFLLLLGILSLGFMEVYFRAEHDFFQDGSERKALAGTLDCLYCGASHGYRAFKPSVIDPILGTQSYNLSGALMTMQGRYELLREEVRRNPVKRVYLELSFNSMTRNRAREGTEGDLYALARYADFLPRLGFFFRAFSLSEYPGVYQKFLSEGIDTTLECLSGETAEHSGRDRGYMPTDPRTIEFETDYAAIFHRKTYSTEIDPYNQRYLDKILELCRQNNIELILITTPLSENALCEGANLQDFYAWYRAFAEKEELKFFDFNLYRDKESLLPDETMFFDRLHLNDEGATRFSQVFAELMTRADAGEDLSPLFYDSYPEMEQAVFGNLEKIN